MITELILSEVTRMRGGYCVIGLQPSASGYRSVLPLPPKGFSWTDRFIFPRGSRLRFDLLDRATNPLHVEDRASVDFPAKVEHISESDCVAPFAIHQSNPRLVELFARKTGVLISEDALVAKARGSLGSATWGVALCEAVLRFGRTPRTVRGATFLGPVGSRVD